MPTDDNDSYKGEFDKVCAVCGKMIGVMSATYDSYERVWYCEKCNEAEEQTVPTQKERKPIPSQSPETLKTLAQQLHRGKIFTSLQIPDGQEHLIGSIFMPIGLKGLEEVDLTTLGIIYAPISRAEERSINGFPIFFCAYLLNREDSKKVIEMAIAIEEAVQSALNGVVNHGSQKGTEDGERNTTDE